MKFIVLVFLTFNGLTCKRRKKVYKSINRYKCLTYMCKASFADGIQNYLGFGDIWMIPY